MSAAQAARIVEVVLSTATVLLFIWITFPKLAPWRVVGETLWRTLRSWRRVLYLAACLSILLANYVYLASGLDDAVTRWVCPPAENGGGDFTRWVWSLEGNAVASIQTALAWTPLTYFLGYVYIVVFACLVIVSIFVFDHVRSRRGLAMVLIGYFLNYLFVLPFYLFFPVREAHVFHGGAVRLLLAEISPAIMEGYRTMSGLNNCFPSFHTSLAVTMALIAWHAGSRRFGWLITLFAAANVLSTVYLGIHWLTDVAAGLVVGVAAYLLARRLSRRWADEAARPAEP